MQATCICMEAQLLGVIFTAIEPQHLVDLPQYSYDFGYYETLSLVLLPYSVICSPLELIGRIRGSEYSVHGYAFDFR